MTSIHPRAVGVMEEAVREIQEMIGLASLTGGPEGETPRGFVLGITAPTGRTGKSTLAAALAATLSDDLGVDVALVDADFETHALDEEFGLSGEQGLTDVLRGSAEVDAVYHRVSDSALRVVPVGTAAAEASRVARGAHAADFVAAVRAANRFVVIDLPPVLPSASAPAMARLCDGVIIVARVGHTTTLELERTVQKLHGAQVRGVVLNRWRTRIPGWVESALALGR